MEETPKTEFAVEPVPETNISEAEKLKALLGQNAKTTSNAGSSPVAKAKEAKVEAKATDRTIIWGNRQEKTEKEKVLDQITEILKAHGGMESSIGLSHDYWKFVNKYRGM